MTLVSNLQRYAICLFNCHLLFSDSLVIHLSLNLIVIHFAAIPSFGKFRGKPEKSETPPPPGAPENKETPPPPGAP